MTVEIRKPNRKGESSVYGVGVNDASYVTQVFETLGYVNGKPKQRVVWFCPFYRKWKGMLERCYSRACREKYPTYTSCTVCEEWLLFSNFKAWMETQDWEGNQLDKDLLVEGNKIYDPKACVFVSGVVNTFLIDSGATRGEWPIGVDYYSTTTKFRSSCSNPFTKKREHLGYFDTAPEAHQAWLTRKLELAKLLAAEQNDPRVAKALINRYENFNK